MLRVAKRKGAKLAAALAAAGLVLTPAFATGDRPRSGPPRSALSFDPISSFTPANADPKLAAALAGKSRCRSTDFKFTPAPAKGRPSQVRVAIRARVDCAGADAARRGSRADDGGQCARRRPAITSASRSAGGASRFPATSPRSRAPIRRSAAARAPIVGVSYSLSNRLSTAASRSAPTGATGNPVAGASPAATTVSLDVGGSYSLSRHIALTGGVRYKIERDRLSALQDDRRDSQAVYVGTAFKF